MSACDSFHVNLKSIISILLIRPEAKCSRILIDNDTMTNIYFWPPLPFTIHFIPHSKKTKICYFKDATELKKLNLQKQVGH